MQYDASNARLTLAPGSNIPPASECPLVANGKIGMVPSATRVDVERSFLTTDFFAVDGRYQKNVELAFSMYAWSLFEPIDGGGSNHGGYALSNATFDFDKAYFGASFLLSNAPGAALGHELRALQGMPYSSLQTVDIRMTSNQAYSNANVYHAVSAPLAVIDKIEYTTGSFLLSNAVLYRTSGTGRLRDSDKTVSFASCYVFEDPAAVRSVALSAESTDGSRAYVRVALDPERAAASNVRVHVLSAAMTSYDYASPADEVKRLLFAVLAKKSVQDLVQDHEARWAAMWAGRVEVDPVTPNDPAIKATNLSLKWALYGIYASTREGINVELNPSSLSIMDFDGQAMYDGDLWLMPALLLFRKDVAKALLDYRFKHLGVASQLAAGYGYQGTKFPYKADEQGYMFWESATKLHAFNTALVAFQAWNYYRITKDREWLTNKGYAILKNVANFFASLAKLGNDGKYHIRDVHGLSESRESDDASFTNLLALMALKAAIEASYDLMYVPSSQWIQVYFNLAILKQAGSANVLKYDAAEAPGDAFEVLEPLVTLTPFYSDMYLRTLKDTNNNQTNRLLVVRDNALHFEPKVDPAYDDTVENLGALAMVYAQVAQYDPATYMPTFETLLGTYVQTHADPFWGYFEDASKAGSVSVTRMDANAAAVYLLSVLALANARVTGGIDSTRVYYEQMKVACADQGANLPSAWVRMRIGGLPNVVTTCTVLNADL